MDDELRAELVTDILSLGPDDLCDASDASDQWMDAQARQEILDACQTLGCGTDVEAAIAELRAGEELKGDVDEEGSVDVYVEYKVSPIAIVRRMTPGAPRMVRPVPRVIRDGRRRPRSRAHRRVRTSSRAGPERPSDEPDPLAAERRAA